MVDSIRAVAVALAFVLPGALFTWEYERALSGWGLSASDRALRFVGSSAAFHAVLAPASWWFYREEVVSGRLAAGHASWWLWPGTLAYVAVPTVAGRLAGEATRRNRRWSRLLTGYAPAPRAWDHVFANRDEAWLRIRTRDTGPGDGGWIFGSYHSPDDRLGAYAAGYGHDRDLYLSDTAWLHPDTGLPLRGPDQQPLMRGVGVLIGWDQIAYIEVMWI
ncbi:DUF6338 family protein [Actinacidiphila paucisporea]|uniref:Uncharacterized protein n=1 Tax=Actinacidiphila paucisporea TaxID=310782 RepID=A0A1M6USZ1_9ACTN|nr:DUF6338 family protein [Actinacidiphila paucisporea]SHK72251.1 hypothetical protein SAMN05216499_101470 [Actinacidiphila paucisporea]